MLVIYTLSLDLTRSLRAALTRIEARDRDLARQARRALASVVLNLAEGSGSFGGTRRERYRSALGSAREVRGALDAAEALGYLDGADVRVARVTLSRVAAGLVKLAR